MQNQQPGEKPHHIQSALIKNCKTLILHNIPHTNTPIYTINMSRMQQKCKTLQINAIIKYVQLIDFKYFTIDKTKCINSAYSY